MNTTSYCADSPPRWRRPGGGIGAALMLLSLLALLLLATAARAAGDHTFSKDSQACLSCHEKPDIADKVLGDGKTLSMHISGKDFLAARHVEQDCTDCHTGIDDKTHGKVKTSLKDRRELMAAVQENCRDCHKKRTKQYDDGLHAALIKAGNTEAPYCANCHNPHYQPNVKILQPIDKTPCAACHEKIFTAWKADVHGLARAAKGKEAPICFDCHQPHENKAASLGEGPKPQCLGCHKTAAEKHAIWLPNSELHFEAISCVVCHSPDAQRRVNLRLYDGITDVQLREKTGVPQFASRVKAGDGGNAGLDAGDLSTLLTQFSRDGGTTGRVVLRGRLEVSSGVEAHQLQLKTKALRTCATCHRQGAEPFKTVVVSIASADGRPLRHDVQQDVLGSATAFQSVRGFYALGGTRIKELDILLVIAVGASIGGCLVHGLARRLFKGEREKRAAAARGANGKDSA